MADTTSPAYGRRRSMTPLAWLVVVGGIVGFIVGVVWLGATPAPQASSSMRMLLENPGAIIVAIISAIAVLGTPVVAKLTAVQREVQNSHKTNLRDDLDEKHDDLLAQLGTVIASQATIIATQEDHGRDIGGLRGELRQLREVDTQQARDIAEVRGMALARSRE